MYMYRPFGYERVYLPLDKVADTPFHIHGGRHIETFIYMLCNKNKSLKQRLI